jgi:hypothetical protein
MPRKNASAQALAKLRWKDKTQAERAATGQRLKKARAASKKLTPKRRKEIAEIAAKARWAKHRNGAA